MDLGTLLGLVLGVAIMVVAILAGSEALAFINLPGLAIVFGGTLAVTLIKFRLGTVMTSVKLAFRTLFLDKIDDPVKLVDQARHLAGVVRKDGVLGLERQTVTNPFLKKCVDLSIDGHPPEFLEEVMLQEIEQSVQRYEVAERMFRGIGDAAPGLGMLGTLVGLVQMLNSMEDPSSIGPAMAVALLTTFYGAFIAQLLALPMADKLQLKCQDEHRNQFLMLNAVLSMMRGQNPRVMTEVLASYLEPDLRNSIQPRGTPASES